MFVEHNDATDPVETLARIGLGQMELQGTQAARIAAGDTAQSYVAVSMDQAQIDKIMIAFPKLTRMAFDAHTAWDRGWSVPDWWPKTACANGSTLQDDSFERDHSGPPTSFVRNWCPAEHRAYIQNFDY